MPNQTLLGREASARWPHFIPAAEKAVGPDGILWSVPMHSEDMGARGDQRVLASARTAGRHSRRRQVLAYAIGDMLVNDPMAYAAASKPPQGEGWSARANVHRAAGILAAQLGTSIADALAVLRSHAFAKDSRLLEVATDVVESMLDLTHG